MKVGDLITNRHGQIRVIVDIQHHWNSGWSSAAVVVLDTDGELQTYSQRYLEEFAWKVGDDTERLE